MVSKATENLALSNILDQELPIHKNGFLRRTFSHLYQAYELKKFVYPQVVDEVLRDERLKHAIAKVTNQQFKDSDRQDDEFYQELRTSNENRAKKLLNDMKSLADDFMLR